MLHLDTNVMIRLLNGRNEAVRRHFDLARSRSQHLAISAVVLHELVYGACSSQREDTNLDRLSVLMAAGGVVTVPFGDPEAHAAGRLRAQLRARGTPIGPFDSLIAASALVAGATLVTANVSEFQRVEGLLLLDWSG